VAHISGSARGFEQDLGAGRDGAGAIRFKKINDRTGNPSVTQSFDTGASWGFFALHGFLKGYVVHAAARRTTACAKPQAWQPPT
jgi:hypothetical protein